MAEGRRKNCRPAAIGEAGFTLLELLVSLTLLAIVMASLTFSLGGFERGFARGVSQASRQDMLMTAASVVRRDLASLLRIVQGERESARFIFEGAQDAVGFVGAERPHRAGGGLVMLRYQIVGRAASNGADGLNGREVGQEAVSRRREQVLLRYQAPFQQAASGSEVTSVSGEGLPTELVAGPFEMRFAFLQSPNPAQQGGSVWLDAWPSARLLPSAIRLTIADPLTPSLAGVHIVVPLRADAEADCIRAKADNCTLQSNGRLGVNAAPKSAVGGSASGSGQP